ncbi:MAG TPA: hypothetical protein PLR41_07910 [Alphaproteobacteria bacterium]|nr:hypothetical protein [Alphaproteobacteria bacterium]
MRAFGCDLAQGYHIGRPMPPDAFRAWLAAYRRIPGAPALRSSMPAEVPPAV